MHKIQAWFKGGCDYQDGVKLYDKHGNNGFLKKEFAKKFSSFNDFTLKVELRAILNAELSKSPSKDKTSLSPVHDLITPNSGEIKKQAIEMSPASVKETSSSELQTKYLQLCKKRDRLYLELNIHGEEKHHLPEGFLLHDCAKQILAKNQQLTEIWEHIDFYQIHQKFPEILRETVKPSIEPEKEIQLLRSAISKANGRLKKENCRNRLNTQKTLEANQARLNVLLANRTGK